MELDIRISVDFFGHPKAVSLLKRYGWEGIIGLQKIWAYTRKYRPKGVLTDIGKAHLLETAGWPEADEGYIDFLVDVGFLDFDKNVYKVHNWKRHNPYAYFSKERSNIARKNVAKRWQKKKSKEYQPYTNGNTNAMQECNTPNPSPSPINIISKLAYQYDPKTAKDMPGEWLSLIGNEQVKKFGRATLSREQIVSLMAAGMKAPDILVLAIRRIRKRPENLYAYLLTIAHDENSINRFLKSLEKAPLFPSGINNQG